MTTELDRLLELRGEKYESPYGLGDKEEVEYKSLKSQLESKLASLQYVDDLINDFGIEKPLDLYLAETQQELSQLRPIVQALREFISDLEANLNTRVINDFGIKTKEIKKHEAYQDILRPILTKLDSILASSEVKQ